MVLRLISCTSEPDLIMAVKAKITLANCIMRRYIRKLTV